jgi:hypothetical protein
MTLKVIRRNATRQIAAFQASHTKCVSHAGFYGFVGHECDASAAWDAYRDHDHAQLIYDTESGKLTVRLANDWYYLTVPPSDG